jgi:GT2 family glycosyltransferase/tetratricopeptide (TPR) repeat protein
MASISACIVARNAVSLLATTIAAARRVTDDVLVVDAASEDGTAGVARAAGARVLTLPWNDDVAALRNAALPQLGRTWVLVLEPGEDLADDTADALRDAVRGDGFDAGFVPVHRARTPDATLGDVVRGRAREGDPVLSGRLLRVEGLAWRGRIDDEPGYPNERPARVTTLDAPVVDRAAATRLPATLRSRLRELQVEQTPRDVRARIRLAEDAWDHGQHGRAAAHAAHAWQLARDTGEAGAPHAAHAAAVHARIALALGRDESARATLGQARALALHHPALDCLESAAWVDTDPQRALAAAERAAQSPDVPARFAPVSGATSWAALGWQGRALLRLDRVDEARATLSRACTHPQVDGAVRLTAIEAEVAAHPQGGLTALQPWLQRPIADAWLLAACAAEALGFPEDARISLARAESLRPYLDPARSTRAFALHALLRMAQDPTTREPPSLQEPTSALRRRPHDPACWAALVGTLSATGHEVLATEVAMFGMHGHVGDATLAALLAPRRVEDPLRAAWFGRRARPPVEDVLTRLGVHSPSTPTGTPPLLTVVLHAEAAGPGLIDALDGLALQDASPGSFEVLLALPDGVAFDAGPRPYPLRTVHGARRMAAVAAAVDDAAGRRVLLLGDEPIVHAGLVAAHARPDSDDAVLLSPHVLHAARAGDALAVIATGAESTDGTPTHALRMHGVSFPVGRLRSLGGVDVTCDTPWGAARGLGLRMDAAGVGLTHCETPVAAPAPADWDAWMARAEAEGRDLRRLAARHGDDAARLAGGNAPLDDDRRRMWVERTERPREQAEAELGMRLLRGLPADIAARSALVGKARAILPCVRHRGIELEASRLPRGTRPRPEVPAGLLSVVMPNLNGFPHVKQCIGTFRATTPTPYQLIVIDNGSTDGSLEWLREQPDVELLEMGRNIGAPAARNRGLAIARGEHVLLCDNDVLFTPRWLDRLLGHLHAWPDVGMVGPVADYVVPWQKVHRDPAPGDTLDSFAEAIHLENPGQYSDTDQLILFFILARREAIDRIGAIDPRYGRWGYEDNDWTLRCRRAGYRMRIARDCFIMHLGSRTSVTANIDYDALLLENWRIFAARWDLSMDRLAGQDFVQAIQRLAREPFDPARDYVPLDAPHHL